jgi:thiosulfate reductase cytochrome b subunit
MKLTAIVWLLIIVLLGWLFYSGQSGPALIEYKRRCETNGSLDTALVNEISKKYHLTHEQQRKFISSIK